MGKSLVAPPGGGADFAKAPEGEWQARCWRVVQLGTHLNQKFGKRKPLVLINWELPQHIHQDGDYVGQPMVVGKRYTFSSHEKSGLLEDLQWWYGKKFNHAAIEAAGGFDLAKILGRPAMLTLEHNDKYVNVIGLSKLEDSEAPPAILEPFFFTFADATLEEWLQLSEGLQNMIRECDEWPELQKRLWPSESPGASDNFPPEDDDDDIPFMFPFGLGLLGLGGWASEALLPLSQMLA